jgi:two-component system sensor histidine kinase ChvG
VRGAARLATRIAVRLLAFNLLLVFLPVAGVYYLDVYERQLLDAQERAMVQEGRVLAAALAGRGAPGLAEAESLLLRLRQQSEARVRVVDVDGRILADSSRLGPGREPAAEARAPETREPRVRDDPRYRIGAWLYRQSERWLGAAPAVPDPDVADGAGLSETLATPEIRAALVGRYGARTRASPGGRRSVTLYCALPIWDGGRVAGAVQVSQSTARLFRALDQTRLGVFQVFLASVAVAAVLSLLVSTTIVRPLRRLRDEAHALLDRRGRIRRRFGGSRRRDEIGELARALEELSRRLEDHTRFTESFAADLAHELKNPLASIRSATELLAEVGTPAERRRFLAIVQREVARVEHLLAVSRELARIDAGIEAGDRPPVDLNGLLAGVVEGYRLRARAPVALDLRPAPGRVVTRGRAGAADGGLRERPRQRARLLPGRRDRHRRGGAAGRRGSGHGLGPGAGDPGRERGADLRALLHRPAGRGEGRGRAHGPRPRAGPGDRRGPRRNGRRGHAAGRGRPGDGPPAGRVKLPGPGPVASRRPRRSARLTVCGIRLGVPRACVLRLLGPRPGPSSGPIRPRGTRAAA